MLAWIIIAFLIALEAKVLRDVIAFRFVFSWLTLLPRWLRDWLTDGKRVFYQGRSVFDGWHVADGLVIASGWVLSMWLYLGNFWWALLTYAPFWIVFYQLFNIQFHWLWMLPEFRESPWKRNLNIQKEK